MRSDDHVTDDGQPTDGLDRTAPAEHDAAEQHDAPPHEHAEHPEHEHGEHPHHDADPHAPRSGHPCGHGGQPHGFPPGFGPREHGFGAQEHGFAPHRHGFGHGGRGRPTLARTIVKSARHIRHSGLTPEQLQHRIATTVSHADYVTTMRTLRRIGMDLRHQR